MDSEKAIVDPKNQYPSEGLLNVETKALELLRWYSDATMERTRDVIQIQLNKICDAAIVLLITAEALEIRIPTIEWTMGAYDPADSSRLWRRVLWDDVEFDAITELISSAQRVHNAEFLQCKYCGQKYPPERRHSDDVCQGCAEAHLGIVH